MVAADADGSRSPYRSIVTIGSVNAEILGSTAPTTGITKAGVSMMSKLYAGRLAVRAHHAFEVRPGHHQDRHDRAGAREVRPLHRRRRRSRCALGRARGRRHAGRDDRARLLPFATGEVVNVGGGMHLHRV
jgi:NAD(P)-dependent dehydrogenase (short-subunit alcohol dehydrogenase family)